MDKFKQNMVRLYGRYQRNAGRSAGRITSWWLSGLLLSFALVVPARMLGHQISIKYPAVQPPLTSYPTQAPPQRATGNRQWYIVDTHVHSAFSSDALVDLGIISQAKALGYDAIFVSDHTGASSFQINHLTANYMIFDDSYARWDMGAFGLVDAMSNELSNVTVTSGEYALHLASQSGSYGESFVTTARGPNLRSGDIIQKIAIFPTRVDPGSGIYMSVSLGGDPSVTKTPTGYTTTEGAIQAGKSVVFVWQLGEPRQTSTDPQQRVYAYSLGPYTLNQWNYYTINVSNYLQDLPAAEQPLPYNGLADIKIAAAANGGSVDAYIDSYSLVASAPSSPAEEFVYRTSVIDKFNSEDFKIFPAYEMGQQKHAHRLNFAITNTVDYIDYSYGSDGVGDTQLSGYPAIFNHPDVTVSSNEVVDTRAFGADLLEVRNESWVAIWDLILQQGTILPGLWSSDAHHGLGVGKPITAIYAEALTLDALSQALYEGRSYSADNNFAGQLLFSSTPNPQEPYPARYPLYVPDTQKTLPVYFKVTGGMNSDYQIRWVRNGQLLAEDQVVTTSYQASKLLALNQTDTYVRAEVVDASRGLRALTQPLFIRQVKELPTGWAFAISSIETANGRDYTNQSVKGITTAHWSPSSNILEVRLENPLAATSKLTFAVPSAPKRVLVNRTIIPSVDKTNSAGASSDSSWSYDKTTHQLAITASQQEKITWLSVDFSETGDREAPQPPSQPTVTALHLGQAELSWLATVDNTGVQGYTIYRDQQVLAVVEAAQLTYVDLTIAPGHTYQYAIAAFDGADNLSAPSPSLTLDTPFAGAFALLPTADTYVNAAAPQTNYGSSSILRIDGDPAMISYLRFDQQSIIGQPLHAALRLYVQSTSAIGYQIHPLLSGQWQEESSTYETAPTIAPAIAASGPLVANSWVEVTVTDLVNGNGPLDLALTTTGDAGIRLAGREAGALAPQLLIETTGVELPLRFYLPLTMR